MKLYQCVYCGHQQPGAEDGFPICEECRVSDGLEFLEEVGDVEARLDPLPNLSDPSQAIAQYREALAVVERVKTWLDEIVQFSSSTGLSPLSDYDKGMTAGFATAQHELRKILGAMEVKE